MKITAPAKLNLYLHITGRRDDDYHLLDSLFVFTDWGDEITVSESDHIELHITGNKVDSSIEDNLVFRAAKLLQEKYKVKKGARIALTKNIPVAAGLGGGSSDAAATLITLNELWGLSLTKNTLAEIGLSLGADVPSCVHQHPAIISGIGDIITPFKLNACPFVLLVNPRKSLETKTVFTQYQKENDAFTQSGLFSTKENDFYVHLKKQKNDLEKPAITLLPDIQIILETLEKNADCRLARMSGSGPTCFGLFDDEKSAENAREMINTTFKNYFTKITQIKKTAE